MRSNSWLYHYYMVQSKLQYGLAYDAHATTRMATAAYYQQPQTYQEIPSGVTYHQMSPSQHPQPHLHPPHAAEPVFRYGRRTEPEPVDYSLHSNQQPELPVEEIRTPHLKREPKSEMSPRSSPSSEVIVDLDHRDVGGSVMMQSTTSSLGRSRLLVKAATTIIDPQDLMEQWNPSPPWSDTTVQKVPDILHQDLSPYVTTTPPTPNSGVSLQHSSHSAFTFDWTPEQYVPNVAGAGPRTPTIDEEHCPHLLAFPWSSEHRLFPLQPPPPGARPSLILRLDSEPMDQSSVSQVGGRSPIGSRETILGGP